MDKRTVAYSYTATLFSSKMKWTTDKKNQLGQTANAVC